MTSLSRQRVLITGGSGFIFSHLTRRLVAMGAEVAVLVRYGSVIDNVRIADVWDDVHVIEADIRDLDALRAIRAFAPQVVYHAAAYNHVGGSFGKFNEVLDVNAKGTANVLESCENFERFIYISTSEVYGHQTEPIFAESMEPHPVSPYSVGKFAGELYCRMKMERMDQPIVVLRPFNAFGPYQTVRAVIPEMIEACLLGRTVRSTEGRQTREFNFVENLVDGFVLAAEKEAAIGQVINLGSGEEIAIRDLITRIHAETGSTSKLEIGALPNRPTEIWRMSASNDRARERLGWSPRVSFNDGLTRTIAWYREYLAQFKDRDSRLCRLCRI
ncbi:UDP-glucose 4-epimerase [Candidatus Magnetaquicoccaceae bacterium FCR-1]|uniref:UDP-glucose 4-epimerase n=1 Tax=Candidatus Magnetaquiglobus chichijimensis TaxID=3141448 RepID=A0ABQ0C7T4_9PROT